MVTKLVQYLGYSCATCTVFTCRPVQVFDLPQNRTTVFYCEEECGSEVLRITPKKSSYHLEAKCSCCGEVHAYDLAKTLFWNTEFYELSCPSCDMGIMMLGSKKRVKEAIKAQNDFLASFAGGFFPDEHIYLSLSIIQAIRTLAGAHALYCDCGSDQITATELPDQISLSCRDCGNQRNIPISDETLEKLLHASTFVLHK